MGDMNTHKLASFKKEVSPLLDLVTKDIYLESSWLSVMSMLEDIAAKYILSNVTQNTPNEALRNIIGHVQDEQRHAQMLLDMRPVSIYPATFYYEIEQVWKDIGNEFIMAFFNSPELREANHRHAAYVHGAQTIERFPFRIYTLYLSKTKLSKVHQMLPQIISDENGHIELGKKMYNDLADEEQMPLSRLYKLEEDLCLMMLKRMKIALCEKLNLNDLREESDLVKKIKINRPLEIAFTFALSNVENYFSPERSLLLKSANTLLRARERSDLAYRNLEMKVTSIVDQYLMNCLKSEMQTQTLLNRMDTYYSNVIYQTNSMALHYAFFRILEDHATVATEQHELETKYWNELIIELQQAEQYEDGLSFSRA